MSRMINKRHKHTRSIVVPFPKVMARFCKQKIPLNLFFNNKTVFKDITFTITKGMLGFININIPIYFVKSIFYMKFPQFFFSYFSMFFPHMTKRYSYSCFFRNDMSHSTFTHFFSYFFRKFISFLKTTFVHTPFFIFIPRNVTFFKTCFLNSYIYSTWHFSLQIKNTLFRFLTDSRLSVSTLLSVFDYRQKNSVNPLDGYSIPNFVMKASKKIGGITWEKNPLMPAF